MLAGISFRHRGAEGIGGERKMNICDACKSEIVDASMEYSIRIKHHGNSVKYDCCTKECCAEVLQCLAEKWKREKEI